MRTIRLGLALSSALTLVGIGCGSDDVDIPPSNGDPYTSSPNKTVVVGAGPGAGTVVATPSGDGCVQLPSGECVKPQDKCKVGERADIVVDSAGKVVQIVCFPASERPTPIDGQGNVDLGKENKGVVSIDGADDGVDVVGNVDSKGNNVTVYGQGPAVSVIGGNVGAEGNNFAMRGVTVKGNVEISGNNAALVLCVVEGNVIIKGNNAVIADCTVLGRIEIDGNNNVLVANEVGSGIAVSDAKNLVCDGNVAWSDANGNKLLDPGETGAAITCSK
jgi:hypothetical protein